MKRYYLQVQGQLSHHCWFTLSGISQYLRNMNIRGPIVSTSFQFQFQCQNYRFIYLWTKEEPQQGSYNQENQDLSRAELHFLNQQLSPHIINWKKEGF